MRWLKSIWPWLLSVVIIFTLAGLALYGYNFSSTGFNSYSVVKTSTAETVPEKFLWDWLNLLIIPIFLVGVGFYLNRAEEKRKWEISHTEKEAESKVAQENIQADQTRVLDRQREDSLQNYFDKMTTLLLDYKLKTRPNETVANLARAKTLAVLRVLDGPRKGLVLKFLFDAGLISGHRPIIDLSFADFSGTAYPNAYLGDANLQRVDFSRASLPGVEFNGADLSQTIFDKANLNNGTFEKSTFRATHLDGINMEGVSFLESKFFDVTFKGDNVAREGSLNNTFWRDCRFERCNFKGLTLTGTQMEGVTCRSHRFEDLKMQKARFSNMDFSGNTFNTVDLFGAEFNTAKFVGTDLYAINLGNSQLEGVDFSHSKMSKVSFRKSELSFEQKTGQTPQLADAIFTGAEMIIGVNMVGANLTSDQLNQMAVTTGLIRMDPPSTSQKHGLIRSLIDSFVNIEGSIRVS